MTALVLTLILAEFAVAAFFIAVCWRQAGQIQTLAEARHAKPRAREVAASARPAPYGSQASVDEAARRLQDAEGLLAAPVQVPAGRHALAAPRRSPSRADLPVQPVPTEDNPPWDIDTVQQDAVDEVDEVSQMRGDYLRSFVAEHGDPTPDMLREAMEGLRELPVYGQAPQLDVLEAERLAEVTQP